MAERKFRISDVENAHPIENGGVIIGKISPAKPITYSEMMENADRTAQETMDPEARAEQYLKMARTSYEKGEPSTAVDHLKTANHLLKTTISLLRGGHHDSAIEHVLSRLAARQKEIAKVLPLLRDAYEIDWDAIKVEALPEWKAAREQQKR